MLLVSRYVTGFSLCYWFLVMLLVSRYVTGFSLCYWFLGYVYLCCFMNSLGVCIVCLSLFSNILYYDGTHWLWQVTSHEE